MANLRKRHMQRTNISHRGREQKKKIKKGQEGVKEGNGDPDQKKNKMRN
jgi:hypothetical protein